MDYNTNNLKVSLASHLRLKPEDGYESPELIYAFNMGRGTTVYQGDNRFSLRDIEFYQHRAELRKKGDWFLRVYRTSEDAGNSYDPYATALQLRDSVIEYADWRNRYIDYWAQNIRHKSTIPTPCRSGLKTALPTSRLVRRAGRRFTATPATKYHRTASNSGSLTTPTTSSIGILRQRLGQTAIWTETASFGYADPGSAHSNPCSTTWSPARTTKREGPAFLTDPRWCTSMERRFSPWWMDEIRVGSNARRYTPQFRGHHFQRHERSSHHQPGGGHIHGVKKRFLEDKFIATATYRADKNQNFDCALARGVACLMPTTKDFLRVSFSSALRNPTLADQYLYLNVGPATLVGNLKAPKTWSPSKASSITATAPQG